MEVLLIISVLLIFASAFFVAAEYSLVSSRRSKIESLSRKGNRIAQKFLGSLDHLGRMVAVCQVGITMVGIASGVLIEPMMSEVMTHAIGKPVDERLAGACAFLVVSFVLVELGELVPKYATLRNPERTALALYRPLRVIERVFFPLTWLAETTAQSILKLFGAKPISAEKSQISKEELVLMIQSGGDLESETAQVVAKAFRLDALDAQDVMIHRLDVTWVAAESTYDEAIEAFAKSPFTRLPVCQGDLDDVIGLLYVHDVLRAKDDPKFDLKKLARPLIAVPENLTLDRMLATMREQKVQFVLVVDEYGGTSGIVTMEDLVEEIFGEMDDQLEGEQPNVKLIGKGRVSARAELRVDELFNDLGIQTPTHLQTETLAGLVVSEMERIPKLGDKVSVEFGVIRVDNMARRRITRVSIFLKPEFQPSVHQDLD